MSRKTENDVAKERDETIRRMLATPPLKHADEKHPRKEPPKKRKAAKRSANSNDAD